MKSLEKGNQKCGQARMAERLMIHEANVRRWGVDRAEERRRRNRADTPPPLTRGDGAGASSSRGEEEDEENLSGVTAAVLLADGREVELNFQWNIRAQYHCNG